MNESQIKQMIETVRSADKVLVGIGEECQYDWLLQADQYDAITSKWSERSDLFPFFQKWSMDHCPDEVLAGGLSNLAALLHDKDYYVVSTGIDDYIWNCGLKEEKIVTPCGGFRMVQCDGNCDDKLYYLSDEFVDQIDRLITKSEGVEQIEEAFCPLCGKPIVHNQIGVSNYCEKGYSKAWARYQEWLQSTIHKKLCVIELGASLGFASIIRNPFEKMVFYNQEASFFRIHTMLSVVSDDIKERSVLIKGSSKEILNELGSYL